MQTVHKYILDTETDTLTNKSVQTTDHIVIHQLLQTK